MAERNDLNGWSMRAAGRYAGLSIDSVRTLVRLDQEMTSSGPLHPVDVLCIRLLGEIGANRSVNRGSRDARTTLLQERDLRAVSLVRAACAGDRLLPRSRLLVMGDLVDLIESDYKVLEKMEQRPGESAVVLPVGHWLAEIREVETGPRRAAAS